MATSQLAENQQCSYEVFGKKHYMACTTQKRAAFQVMGSKTMQCSPAFPLVLTSYKLLEIERTVIETCLTATLRPTTSRHTHRRFSPVVLPAAHSQSGML